MRILKFKKTIIIFVALIAGIVLARLSYKPIQRADPEAQSVSDTSNPSNPPAVIVPNQIIATVGDIDILGSELNWESEEHSARSSLDEPSSQLPSHMTGQNTESLQKRLLLTLVERKLLYQWIIKHSDGFDHSQPSRYTTCTTKLEEFAKEAPDRYSEGANRQRLKEKLCEHSLIQQYLAERVSRLGAVPMKEIEAYYKENSASFRSPSRISFLQILLANEGQAKSVRSQLNSGNFKELAKKYSIAAEASQGGVVGPFSKEQLPEFFSSIFSMPISDISDIIRSDYGFHIVMPIQKHPASLRPLTEVRKEIIQKLEEKRTQDQYQAVLNKAMNAFPVKIYLEVSR